MHNNKNKENLSLAVAKHAHRDIRLVPCFKNNTSFSSFKKTLKLLFEKFKFKFKFNLYIYIYIINSIQPLFN